MMSYSVYTTTSPVKWTFGFILSLFLFSSCSDPSVVGLQLAPENNQIGVFFEEFDLSAEVVLLDSFNTTNQTILVVGNEEDDYFGKTKGTGYTRLFIDVFEERPRTDAILDSIFFTLDVVSVNGSDLGQAKKISVHKLSEPILDTLYYNFNKLTFEQEPFASADVIFGETKDSTLLLPVEENFTDDLFDKLKRGEEFETLFNFRDYLPGVAIQIDDNANTTAGISVGFQTGIQLFYHYNEDTVSIEYSINSASSRSFSGVESDRSGTPTAVVTEYGKAYSTGNKLGMKASLGMVLKVDTSPFDAFLDTLEGITFNQVNFEITEIDEVPEGQNPISSMVMYFTDESNQILTRNSDNQPLTVQRDGQPQIELDQDGNEQPTVIAPAIVEYQEIDGIYIQQITSYLNSIYRGKLMRKDWLLYGNSPARAGDDFKRSMRQYVLDKDKIKVRVIYSKRN